MPEHYITAGGKRLRCGRTTGTCAAMAAGGGGAAAPHRAGPGPDLPEHPQRLDGGGPLLDCVADGETAACSVEKDGGDDVDATHGLPIRATVRRRAEGGTAILGGPGVGRVTRPGLDQPVGEAAINSVPRRMIAGRRRKRRRPWATPGDWRSPSPSLGGRRPPAGPSILSWGWRGASPSWAPPASWSP